jgi:hypothetical protein
MTRIYYSKQLGGDIFLRLGLDVANVSTELELTSILIPSIKIMESPTIISISYLDQQFKKFIGPEEFFPKGPTLFDKSVWTVENH